MDYESYIVEEVEEIWCCKYAGGTSATPEMRPPAKDGILVFSKLRNNDSTKSFVNKDLRPIDHLSLHHTSVSVAQSALPFVPRIPLAGEK